MVSSLDKKEKKTSGIWSRKSINDEDNVKEESLLSGSEQTN